MNHLTVFRFAESTFSDWLYMIVRDGFFDIQKPTANRAFKNFLHAITQEDRSLRINCEERILSDLGVTIYCLNDYRPRIHCAGSDA